MQGKAQEHEAAYAGERLVRLRLRGHPAPERLPTGEQREPRRDAGGIEHSLTHARLGHRGRIGPARPLFHIEELVAVRRYSPFPERLRDRFEKRMAHPRAGPVRQHEQGTRASRRDEQVIHPSPVPPPRPYRILPRRSGPSSVTTIFCSSRLLPSVRRTTYSPGSACRSSSADVGSPNPRGRGRSRFSSHVTRCSPGNPEPVRVRIVSPAAFVITSFTPSGCMSLS